jgi:hypothetical protein
MTSMRKIDKPSPTESPLIVRTGPSTGGRDPDRTGQHAPGVQAFRSLGLPGSAKQHVVVKERQRGYDYLIDGGEGLRCDHVRNLLPARLDKSQTA